MSDTEEAQTPVKAKRTMTPEARERMLANLAKGREAKLKKLSEAKKIRDEENDKKNIIDGEKEKESRSLACSTRPTRSARRAARPRGRRR